MKRWFGTFRSTEAAEIAEMAMVLPVMFFVFLGIFWAGRMYNISATLNQAARQGARAAVQPPCGSCSTAWDPAAMLSAVDAAVTNVLQADRLDPTQVTGPTTAPAPNDCSTTITATCATTSHNISVCRNALLTPPTVTPAVCGVMVQFTYKLDLPQITMPFGRGTQGILPQPQIAGRAQMAVEQ